MVVVGVVVVGVMVGVIFGNVVVVVAVVVEELAPAPTLSVDVVVETGASGVVAWARRVRECH